jgi:phosphatidylglycerophosphate synthase
MAAGSVVLLASYRLVGRSARFARVTQQGGTFFLDLNFMHAGYWMLQPAVRCCTRFGITPFWVSWFSLVPAIAAGTAAATGHWGIAAWLLLAAALLDVMDGAVARANGNPSPAGAVLDSVLDRYAEFIFFAGLFAYYRAVPVAALLVFTAFFGSFLVTYSSAKAEALRLSPPRGSMKRSDRLAVLIVGTAAAPLYHAWFEPAHDRYAWPVLAAVTIIAVFANVSAIQRFTALAREARAASTRDAVAVPNVRREPPPPRPTPAVTRGDAQPKPASSS